MMDGHGGSITELRYISAVSISKQTLPPVAVQGLRNELFSRGGYERNK